MSQSSLYQWRKLFEATGSAANPPSPIRGRPHIIGMVAFAALKKIYLDNPGAHLNEVHILDKMGLTRKILCKIAIKRNEERQGDFRMTIRTQFSGSGDEFVAVDELSKDEHTLSYRYGQSLAPFVCGDQYSLVAAMSMKGYIATRVVEGSVDSFEFFDFIAEEVVPKMHPFTDAQSILVMDNCCIHHNETLQDFLNAAGIMLLYLPPYSPDLNPIKESFSTCK
ncbi:tc1-mariner class transposase [Moniliophthora roreri MCA 2997]|uniref:Tc1-mariner class transposase n=1 Tax=Moniliophthora roreri (strain MCA 2997) TaxID=1381753 RepID=V2WYT7_MONRO|nr:tc1-mariner class transposase [Moniliophthora roreri MCA 2997]